MNLSKLITPLFWIAATWAGITYGPILIARAQGKIPADQVKNQILEKSPEIAKTILGSESNEGTSSSENNQANNFQKIPPPQTIQQIPDYAQQIVEVAVEKVVQAGTTTVQQTTRQVTEGVCEQIITEIRKSCNLITPAPEPTITPNP